MREELKAVENAMKKYKKTTNSSAPSSSLNSQVKMHVILFIIIITSFIFVFVYRLNWMYQLKNSKVLTVCYLW
jgi:hypothetical protein